MMERKKMNDDSINMNVQQKSNDTEKILEKIKSSDTERIKDIQYLKTRLDDIERNIDRVKADDSSESI